MQTEVILWTKVCFFILWKHVQLSFLHPPKSEKKTMFQFLIGRIQIDTLMCDGPTCNNDFNSL